MRRVMVGSGADPPFDAVANEYMLANTTDYSIDTNKARVKQAGLNGHHDDGRKDEGGQRP